MTLLDLSRHSAHPLSSLATKEGDSQPNDRPLAVRVVAVTARALADPVHLPETAVKVMQNAMSIGRLVAPAAGRRSSVLVGHSTDWHFDVCERPLKDLKRAGTVALGRPRPTSRPGLAGKRNRRWIRGDGEGGAKLLLADAVYHRAVYDPKGSLLRLGQ
jgi:hypothetical protein